MNCCNMVMEESRGLVGVDGNYDGTVNETKW
jgi:hypothetical protein